MQQRLLPALFLAAALATPESGRAGADPPAPDLRAAVRPLVEGSADLGCELHRALAKPGSNALLSPLSISLALAMVREGALGATADEMDRVLHLRMADLAGTVGRLRDALDGAGDSVLLANGLWHRADSPLNQAYRKRLLEHYDVEPRAFDPAALDLAVVDVNRWVAERTQGRIRDLLPPDAIHDQTEAVLANAIYFRADWGKRFEAAETRPARFSLSPAAAADVPTMHQTARLPYGETQDALVVDLPYRGGAFSMLLVLPKVRHGLAALEERLCASQIAAWAEAAKPRTVLLSLPKFTIEAKPPLKDALLTLGATAPFAGGDFGGISDGSFAVDDVVHQAVVAVEESGTTAAAATAISVTRGGDDFDFADIVEFAADRPFLFAIRHRPTGAVLFLGRVVDPR